MTSAWHIRRGQYFLADKMNIKQDGFVTLTTNVERIFRYLSSFDYENMYSLSRHFLFDISGNYTHRISTQFNAGIFCAHHFSYTFEKYTHNAYTTFQLILILVLISYAISHRGNGPDWTRHI